MQTHIESGSDVVQSGNSNNWEEETAMKKENLKYGIICAVSLVLFVLLAVFSAANMATDMIMPSVYITNGMTTWYVMLLGLLAEAVIVRHFLKADWFRTAAITLVMNLISTALSFITFILAGLIVELLFIPFANATFHVTHWIATFLLVILTNACVEGLAAKAGFQLEFKKNFARLCLANAISLAISFLLNLSWVGSMYM